MAFVATSGSTTRSVLVIDDELKIGELVAHFLREDGVKVLIAQDGQEGLSILRQQPVDVLFTDLCLPGEDGVDVLQKALRLRPQLTTVMMTGHGSLESSVDVFRLGAELFYFHEPYYRGLIGNTLVFERTLSPA